MVIKERRGVLFLFSVFILDMIDVLLCITEKRIIYWLKTGINC